MRVLVGADALLQAVEEDGRRHAAHQREITATVEAIGFATHARHVAQRVLMVSEPWSRMRSAVITLIDCGVSMIGVSVLVALTLRLAT